MSNSFSTPAGWKTVTLNKLGEVNRGRSRHRPRDAAELYGGEYPFIQTGDVKASGGRIINYTQTYNETGLAQSRLWPKKTMCITIAANIAETGILTFPACFPDSIIGFIADESLCDVYYVEYVFRLMKQRIQAQATGSVQDNINLKTLEKIAFSIPPLNEQKRIVMLLKGIDDQILLNTQINQLLEEAAQAIFKSWFVDFDPVKAKMATLEAGGTVEDAVRAAMRSISGKADDELQVFYNESPEDYAELKATAELFPSAMQESELGMIPEGWECVCISDVCHFQNGYAFKSKEMVKYQNDTYKVFKMGGIAKGGGLQANFVKDYFPKEKSHNLGKYLIKKGDLLMCMTDMKNNVALLGHTAVMDVDNEYLLNQRVGLLRSLDEQRASFPYLYLLTNSEDFIADLRSRANSGVQVNLSTAEIKHTKLILPAQEVHQAFSKIVTPLFEQQFANRATSYSLTLTRDTLLPKLLSGELIIPETEEELAAAQ